MQKHQFTLAQDQEYIPLNKLLQVLQIAQTGGHAKIIILDGEVLLNGVVERQIRKKIRPNDQVRVGVHEIMVCV
ncbi:RNA-binding S4 domain-containing protein [Flavobacteriaceae bacterium F08102]|nr:RNA-binding S4 domain-containing protein [Flavobacteriaceae bacterium F08102]